MKQYFLYMLFYFKKCKNMNQIKKSRFIHFLEKALQINVSSDLLFFTGDFSLNKVLWPSRLKAVYRNQIKILIENNQCYMIQEIQHT